MSVSLKNMDIIGRPILMEFLMWDQETIIYRFGKRNQGYGANSSFLTAFDGKLGVPTMTNAPPKVRGFQTQPIIWHIKWHHYDIITTSLGKACRLQLDPGQRELMVLTTSIGKR